ncbi:MAG: DUF6114 domain-containing protein [Nitrososphaeria archaeon]
MSDEDYPKAAYTLSLIAGVLMLINSVLFIVIMPFLAVYPVRPRLMFMMMFGLPFLAFGAIMFLGLASAIVVLISALMLKSRPAESTTWGVLILVFSLMSFFGMGGFIIGAILGIIGGAMAMAYNPKTKQ